MDAMRSDDDVALRRALNLHIAELAREIVDYNAKIVAMKPGTFDHAFMRGMQYASQLEHRKLVGVVQLFNANTNEDDDARQP